MNIYVASSWKNNYQKQVVKYLESNGFEVYDFKHPGGDLKYGFHWSEIDLNYKNLNFDNFKKGLTHKNAEYGFNSDKEAIDRCDGCVLVMPCGRSSHLELGYARGLGKITAIYYPYSEPIEPELMYKFCPIFNDLEEVVNYLKSGKAEAE